MDIERERDIEQLRLIARTLETQNKHLLRALNAKCKELEALKGDPTELQQTLELLERLQAQVDQGKPKAQRKAKGGKKQRERFGNTPQPKLSEVEQSFELDDSERQCPACGGEVAPLGDEWEESELIDCIQVSYRRVKVRQRKYACKCGGHICSAPGPERAIAGSRYSLDFAVKAVSDKYCDHLPLSRQVRIAARHGLEVTSQTLWDLSNAICRQLEPTSTRLLELALTANWIGLDQTGWPSLDGKKDKPWQMWAITTDRIVCHRIRDNKGAATFLDLVGDYRGVIVCDALSTHGAAQRDGPGFQLAGCWAHVFRKFREAEPDHPQASKMLEWIGRLYEIDDEAQSLEGRGKLRAGKSLDVLAEMRKWLLSQAVPKSLSIGNASMYTLANWERLTLFTKHADLPLDNNGTERAIRGPVVGRKNHYGSKSRRGTEVAATMYTLIETAKLNSVDPMSYLREAVLASRRGQILLPWEMV